MCSSKQLWQVLHLPGIPLNRNGKGRNDRGQNYTWQTGAGLHNLEKVLSK